VLAIRGDHPGLVHIISAMEACDSYKPWHDKRTHRTFLRPDSGKCLHYYFYFIDAELGLIYLRVPTWCPFRLQFYCNGHSWLARQLAATGIGFTLADNVFLQITILGAVERLFWARTGNNRARTQHFRHFWMSISRLSIARARARAAGFRFSARGPKVPTPPAGQAG
jgi:hypothetical protein